MDTNTHNPLTNKSVYLFGLKPLRATIPSSRTIDHPSYRQVQYHSFGESFYCYFRGEERYVRVCGLQIIFLRLLDPEGEEHITILSEF
jgi:hypothetical protein